MKVVTYEPEAVRPDLPAPLSPLRGLPEVVRRCLLGLREPDFERAHQSTAVWAAVTVAVTLVSLLLPPPWRSLALACSVLLGLYLLIRIFALAAFERRQHAFEPHWLAAQSEVLRGHAFEVLRFTVHSPYGAPGARRTYDLTRPDDIRALFRRQERERASGEFSRATVEFVYWAGGDILAVADVTRELSDLTFLPGRSGPARAWIRFPEARYLSRPGTGKRPALRTYWALSGPVVVTASESISGGTAGSAAISGLGSAR